MNARLLPQSLAVRVTLLCALISIVITGMLGASFFFNARTAITDHADEQLVGRATYFRQLAAETLNDHDLRDRSMLLQALLGSANDVVILRRRDQLPVVAVNPARVEVPAEFVPVEIGRAITNLDVHRIDRKSEPRMHWVAALTRGPGGSVIEVLVGHPLTSEMRMIEGSRNGVLGSTFAAMVACALLVWLVLLNGLRPLRLISAQAALINPINLATRLSEHNAPAELRKMVATFNSMLDRIAIGYERLSQFSADLAHEIRTPIGTLLGQTQVALGRTRTVDEYQRLLESNLEEFGRLGSIVDSILFLAQADHASLQLEKTPLALKYELLNIAEYFEGPAEEAGLNFSVQATGEARVNAALCRRALHNLVLNALRYSTSGTTVTLTGVQHKAGATIVVESDGTPIPQDQCVRLFDRFYRADSAAGRSAESRGLGLSIVKAIMDLHEGEATASCSPTGRYRFELRFPP
jgi:two-component system, OmpR family, heavy metal sensor histidine kinase CusS